MRTWLGVAVLAVVLAAGSADAQPVKRINIAGGPIGGTWYVLAGGIARLVEKYAPGVRVSVEAGGGIQNARNVGLKRVVFGFAGSDNAYYAVKGSPDFPQTYELRGVLVGHPNHLHIVTLADSGIRSVADFRGKRIAVGPPGSNTDALSRVVFAAYGIGENDVKREWLQFREMVEAIKDRTVDAGFLAAGAPASSIIDLTTLHAVRFVPLEPDKIEAIVKEHPYLRGEVIARGTYKGQSDDVPVIANLAYLVTHKDTDETLVYNVAKAVTEHLDELKAVHPVGAAWGLEKTARGMAIELHDGMKRLLREKKLVP